MTIFRALHNLSHAGRARTPVICAAYVATTLFALSAGAAPAFAEESRPEMPWWHVNVGARPSNLQAGAATDEVQELTIRATSGEALVIDPETEELVVFPYDATHEAVQTALEAPSMYGAGNVEVTGGPGDEKGTKPYIVTFKGSLGSRQVDLINTEYSAVACDFGLGECLEGTATSTQVTAGKPSGTIVVFVTNLGDGEAHGETMPVTVTDTLPKGVEATEAKYNVRNFSDHTKVGCTGTLEVVCSFSEALAPYELLEIQIKVKVASTVPPGELSDRVSVSGGGAQAVSVSDPLTVNNPSKTPFGVEMYEIVPENADGSIDTRAGSHPFQLTTTFTLNAGPEVGLELQPALPKDLHFVLPAGLVGNPTPFPTCPEAVFNNEDHCPADTQVGVIVLAIGEPTPGTIAEPIYNVPAPPGEPARFGFSSPAGPVFLDTAVRTGSDYGVTVNVDNITQTGQFLASQTTFWGVPGDPRHNRSRNEDQSSPSNYCLERRGVSPASCPGDTVGAPFLALPTSCEQFESSLVAESWAGPNQPSLSSPPLRYTLHDQSNPSLTLDRCEGLGFEPSIRMTPDGEAGSTPSGLNVDVHVPQASILVPNGVAESDVKDITVALPPGVAINPAAGDGLQACTQAQIGFTKVNPLTGVDEFTPGEPSCPDASKIATVTIHSPLLPNPLKGFVYLAAPQNFQEAPPENPFSSLVAMYIVAKDPVSGVLVKLPGKVSLNESTGQLITTFKDNPRLAFEDAELNFFGGERAPLASPALCGSYTTNASFTPWSGNAAVASSSTFRIASGPNGSACPGAALPFSPSLHSSSANIQAGGFTPFTTTFSREDGQQNLQGLQLHLPAGFSGLLTGVELCSEADANAGTCGPGSLIGETIVSVGVGGDPFSVTGGKVYITEKYEGAPFGLSIVNPAKAGPFDLQEGRPVVVRARIEVNPSTAALTITTDDTGRYKIPTIIDGIPLQIKHVNVTIDRPGFTFNPTSCNPMKITGAIQSVEGASSNVEVPFQVTDCAALKFAPKFQVSTSGKTSKVNGASLSVKLTYPNAPFGTQANIAKVKVDLPKQLPSRLTTLQKACTNAQFESNPAGCPAASIIGHARAITPLIPVPLEGPAYFVSHGGEAFPSLIMVLQGYGVRIDLVGTTFISKAGITSSTFKKVPDAPVGSFELTLPEGRYSALGTNKNLCTQKLAMPTAFVAQNGAEIHESTKVAVTGCHKAKKAVKKKKRKKGKARKTRRK